MFFVLQELFLLLSADISGTLLVFALQGIFASAFYGNKRFFIVLLRRELLLLFSTDISDILLFLLRRALLLLRSTDISAILLFFVLRKLLLLFLRI